MERESGGFVQDTNFTLTDKCTVKGNNLDNLLYSLACSPGKPINMFHMVLYLLLYIILVTEYFANQKCLFSLYLIYHR